MEYFAGKTENHVVHNNPLLLPPPPLSSFSYTLHPPSGWVILFLYHVKNLRIAGII